MSGLEESDPTMSAPYSQPPRDSARRSTTPVRKEVLILAAAAAGAIGYLLGFFDDTAGVVIGSIAGFALVAASVLAGLWFVPRVPNALFAAIPLSGYATLALLQQLVRGTAGGLGGVLVLLSALQCAALLGVVLVDGGVLAFGTRTQPSRPSAPPHPPAGAPRGPAGGPNGAAPNGAWNPQARPMQGPPVPPNPPWGQPVRPPSSDGVPIPAAPNNQGAPKPEPVAPKPESPDGGPQGTRQMPHPPTGGF